MSSSQISISTLFKSTDFWAINKKAGQHWNEVLTQSDGDWEALHRLDFLTSGAMLFCEAKHIKPFRDSIFKSAATKKIYIAGCRQPLPDHFLNQKIEGFVGSRYRSSKKTRFSLERESFRGFHNIQEASHIVTKCEDPSIAAVFSDHIYQIQLISGCRHQIRTFFEWAKSPINGDPIYEGTKASRLQLHAWKLVFKHPLNSNEIIQIEAPIEN
ncbi:hypothetical protein GW915_03675 [bacterium]|nr:hypothetical protein [bacterium]